MNGAPYPDFTILLVDDEPAWLRSLTLTLESLAGLTNIRTLSDSSRVMDALAGGGVGLVLLDLTMPPPTGEELLAMIAERHPEVACIVVSGLNQIEGAVRCMRLGAYDYFVKTDEEDRIAGGVLRAVKMIELREENARALLRVASGGPVNPEAFAGMVTRSRTMFSVFAYVEAVAGSPQPLLVTGESGVGKEDIVRAAHALSGRSGPLVAVNVAGLDDTVFADTLFGHVRGAYTGADAPRKGMIEEAAGGTLFLDEIGDLSVASQVKLLRLLQEGEYFPLGSDRPKRLSARVIVATHRDLAEREAEGAFRRDLYYRLRTHHVHVPPLRERPEDVEPLLEHFLALAARELGKSKPVPPRELVRSLSCYPFPGNVRELKSMAYDAVSLHRDGPLRSESFLKAMGQAGSSRECAPENPFSALERLLSFAEADRLLTEEAMARSGGNQTMAARILGVSQPALSKRLKQMRESAGGNPPT